MAIALKDWSQFELLSENLLKNNFVKGKPKQRFYYKGVDGKNDYEIDIVPFGELEEDEKVAWPPEGNPEMSVKCFRDVMNIADTVVIEDAITIRWLLCQDNSSLNLILGLTGTCSQTKTQPICFI